jgi:hypothetical protein
MNPAVLLLLTGVMNPLTVPQTHVLPVFGCGAGCRVETEQLSKPEMMNDGWIRVKVRQHTWINRCDWETKECRDESSSGRAGPPVIDLWLFADCPGERFSTSKNSDRTNSWEQDVFYKEGNFAKQPKYQTVHGNPFMRWAKLCPVEAEEGMRFIQ